MKRSLSVALAVLAAAACPPAWADKTVNFNIPVTLTDLDPQVTGFFMACAIKSPTSLLASRNGTVTPLVNRSYSGTVSVAVTVADADVGNAKSWTCTLRLTTPGLPTGATPNSPSAAWSAVAPGAVTYVSGNF